MPGTTRNLTLMLLPQSWDGHHLIANLLLLPAGNPTVPVPLIIGQELPFSTAQPVLRAALLPGLTVPAWDPSMTPAMLTYIPLTLSYSAAESTIFSALSTQFTPVTTDLSTFNQPAGAIYKDLPESYLDATGFQTPDSDVFTTGDGFLCSLGSTASAPNINPVSATTINWGEIISYALRQPLIAQAMGLIYSQVSIPLTAAQVAGGGWIWIEIDSSSQSNWYAKLITENPQAVFTYAARLPALTATAQDVFAAVLFPTVPGNYISSVLDSAQYEADLYLDGFAKLLHSNQPTSSDAVTNDSTAIVPGTDAGIQIGWDDEQVTTWINRQVQIAQGLTSPPPPPLTLVTPELPFTVLGYRVDVRQHSSDPWSSLCAASGTLSAAGVFSTSFTAQDLCVEPTPVQNGSGDYWLPQYFAQWRGRTLVVTDPYGYVFSGGQFPPPALPSDSEFTGTTSESMPAVSLRYGQPYQFRTRLADLTGGGPEATDASPNDAGSTSITFKRYVPPKKVRLTLGAVDSIGNQPLTVDRPGINYPEMVFAGAADQATLAALQAITPAQPPAGSATPTFPPPFQAAVLDPDVAALEIIVEALAPTHDTGNAASLADADTPPVPGDLDGAYRVVYTWQIPFPAISLPVAVGASTPIQLTLQPTVMNQIDAPTLPTAAQPTVIPIPTGRNVRIRLRGLGTPDPDNLYFGSSVARTGLISDMNLRYDVPTESGVIEAGSLDQQLQAFYLRNLDQSATQDIVTEGVVSAIQASGGTLSRQNLRNLVNTINTPPTTPIQLLASALQLQVSGLTLSAAPGQRILFGAQSSLRCTVPQDRSSITFSSLKDLINHWVVVQQLTLDRDWTWSGLAQNGAGQIAFTFMGASAPAPNEVVPAAPALTFLGQVNLPNVVSSLATQQGAPGQRDSSQIIFFSTLDSTVPAGDFPTPTEGFYQLQATLTGSPTTAVTLWNGNIMVPITANPQQIPQLVSAGIAESPYVAAANYSSTTQRQRALWLEFDRPPLDPNDSYFIRVENYGPDPLLISYPFDMASAIDTPIALDPEPIRTITPDSTNDDAGLAAMTELIPSTASPVHFLVPLPGGISPSALDLFGFWTYELRCGHLQWSTAQGRFGRPLRVAGVQHPCPPLTVNVERVTALPTTGGAAQPCISATADLAQTVLDDVSLTLPAAPQTQIWFLLYAQLLRADGEVWRNLLLAKLAGVQPEVNQTFIAPPSQQQSIPVTAAFAQSAIDDILFTLRLPANTPLSVLAVELFNKESLVIQDNYYYPEISALPAGLSASVLKAGGVVGGSPSGALAAASQAGTAVKQQDAVIDDPLGEQLGAQRILRVSPLAPVRAVC
jgi:hypothetical protein